MKSFVILAAVLAVAVANPQVLYTGYPYVGHHVATLGGAAHYPVQYAAAPAAATVVAPAFTKTQYHAQDELGQASYGYAYPGQAAAAVRDAAGNVRGSYAYIDPTGREVRVNYVADGAGYRAESNALPEGPVASPFSQLVGPAPVQETPEVAAARAQHLAAHAVARGLIVRKKRQVVVAAASPVAYSTAIHHPFAYSSALHHQVAYNAAAIHHPVAYNAAAIHHPVAYTAAVHSASPALIAPALRAATLTKVVNTPGHAVSYRVD